MPAYLTRVGLIVFAMLFAIALVTEDAAAGTALAATVNTSDGPAAIPAAFMLDGPVAVAGFQALPPAEVATTAAVIESVSAEIEPVSAEPAAPVVATVVAAPASNVRQDAIVLASWYGPGFYGNRTACGQVYTPQIMGVAHKTLPCGTLLILTYGSQVLSVPVIDRGPYIVGRTLDLSNATKLAIGCTDLCTLRMQVRR